MDHLHPSVRPQLSEPPDRRIHYLRSERWIGYAAADSVLKELEVHFSRPRASRMPGVLLIADPNQGKSSILRRFHERHPTVNDPKKENISMPVMMLECPPNADERRFYRAILNALGAPYPKHAEPDWMHREIQKQLTKAGTRILLLDEVQNVFKAGPAKQRECLAVLRYLTNTLLLPIVLAGNEEAQSALTIDQSVARRFRLVKLSKWRDREAFTVMLNSFEKLLPLAKPSRLNARSIVDELMALSDGILGEVSYLLTEAACAAVEFGTEQITLKNIRDVPFVPPPRRHERNPSDAGDSEATR